MSYLRIEFELSPDLHEFFIAELMDMDFYGFVGDIKSMLNAYTRLTGKAAIPPKFSFGTWIARMSYCSQEETKKIADNTGEIAEYMLQLLRSFAPVDTQLLTIGMTQGK